MLHPVLVAVIFTSQVPEVARGEARLATPLLETPGWSAGATGAAGRRAGAEGGEGRAAARPHPGPASPALTYYHESNNDFCHFARIQLLAERLVGALCSRAVCVCPLYRCAAATDSAGAGQRQPRSP